ncbi:putative methyltransferase-domain-containing protein [Xylariales sp. PMI_506]|nr:putative methyltransferase-domain-containing protein [Xylariales sp. PMI_506]
MASEDRSPSPELDPLAISEDLTPLPEYKQAATAGFDFSGLLAKPLTLHEDLTSGCGGQTWPAGMVLARHMLRYHRDDLRDSRILELGAGGGLVGLAVASGCQLEHPLYITDQLEMFSLMGHNIVLNEMTGRVRAAILNWGEALAQEIVAFKPNVILAADCVYFEPAFPLLLTTLSDLLTLCPTAIIYFCFKKRRRADMQFLKKARKAFNVAEIFDEDRPVFSREGLFLYAITSKATKPNVSKDCDPERTEPAEV